MKEIFNGFTLSTHDQNAPCELAGRKRFSLCPTYSEWYDQHSPLDLPDRRIVVIEGIDESEKFRFLVFSEGQLESFTLEVKNKKDQTSKAVGFNVSAKSETTDEANPPS